MALMTDEPTFWRRCSSCKDPIGFKQDYFVCSVSTCNRKRTGLVFCSMACWGAHVPTMGHRDPWAEERRSPGRSELSPEPAPMRPAAAPVTEELSPSAASASDGGVRRRVAGASTSSPSARAIESFLGDRSRNAELVDRLNTPGSSAVELNDGPEVPHDVLVVVSKMKAYIKARSGMNTSASVNEALSDLVRGLCDDAIQRAAADERKTVMGRDFPGGR